jgi:hypothetical protein
VGGVLHGERSVEPELCAPHKAATEALTSTATATATAAASSGGGTCARAAARESGTSSDSWLSSVGGASAASAEATAAAAVAVVAAVAVASTTAIVVGGGSADGAVAAGGSNSCRALSGERRLKERGDGEGSLLEPAALLDPPARIDNADSVLERPDFRFGIGEALGDDGLGDDGSGDDPEWSEALYRSDAVNAPNLSAPAALPLLGDPGMTDPMSEMSLRNCFGELRRTSFTLFTCSKHNTEHTRAHIAHAHTIWCAHGRLLLSVHAGRHAAHERQRRGRA